jgi:hypothetical protein
MIASKDAPGTVKTQAAGDRIRFVRRAGLSYFLFTAADLPLSHEQKERVEIVRLVFTAF